MNDIQEKAVPYYACMIIRLLNQQSEYTLETLVGASFDARTPLNSDAPNFRLYDDEVTFAAIAFLEREFVLRHIPDEFGPALVLQHGNFSANRDGLYQREDTVFEKYRLAGERRGEWLNHALDAINTRILATSSDVATMSHEPVGSAGEYWAPLPLDRLDETLSTAIESIDTLVEDVRANNGYGAEHSEEKKYVLDKLSALARTLKQETSISWMYIKEFAIEPIGILIGRFGPAALGIAAEAAKASIKEWLKKKGLTFLDGL